MYAVMWRNKAEYLHRYDNVVVTAEAAPVAEPSLEEQEAAATKIQALFRGIHDRAKVEAMKHEQVESVSSSTYVN